MKEWAEISIQTALEAVEAVANVLHEAGAGGVVIEDPTYLPANVEEFGAGELPVFAPSNGKVTTKAYLPVNDQLTHRLQAVQDEVNRVLKLLSVTGDITLQRVAEEEWATAWKAYYKPFRVGNRIIVKPAWETYQGKTGDIVIELDPGMAFGTGNHPTTTMSLILLEQFVKPGFKVFDIGTGSGILAIAAAKLGASEVVAVDVDPVAIETAWENCQRNKVSNIVSIIPGNLLEELSGRANIVVANITADVLLDLIVDLKPYLISGGVFIGSGIIDPYFQDVRDALADHDFKLLEISGEEEWVAFAAVLD